MLNIAYNQCFKICSGSVQVGRKVEKQASENLIGYARVSTEEQSLEMQIAALVKSGVPRKHISVEKVSAAVQVRPELEAIIDGLRSGDTLVVWKMDRIARSLVDLLNKMGKIEAAGARFKSLTEQIDTTTPAGKLLFHVLGALAEFERDLIVERTRSGVKAAKARGVRFGQQPKLSPTQVKEAQRLRNKGQSIRQIAEFYDVSHNTIRNWTTGPGRKRRKT